jgi:hypothetical protein
MKTKIINISFNRTLKMLRLFKISILFLVLITPVANGQQNPNSLSFDGTNDYVSLGNQSQFKPTTNLTVEARVNFANWNVAGNQDIVSTFNTQGYVLRLQSGSLAASVYRNNALGTASYSVATLTGWHHVAFTFNGRYIYLYIDGTRVATNNAGATYSITYNTGTNTTIGALSSGTSEFVNGTIDEIRIWSAVRTAAQLTSAMNTELATTTASLIAYYRFNQGTAAGTNAGLTTLNDLTTNAINGTLYNFALSGSASNWVNGYPLKPIDQSTSVTFSNVQGNQLTVNWIRPGANKGGNFVKVFMRQATSGSSAPVDGTAYTANAAFGSGTQIGTTGWYCVYEGSGTSATVTNLTARNAYRTHVIEYQNISGLTVRYYTATATGNPANQTTDYAAPAIQASNITFSSITASGFTINWTRGNGSNCVVFVKLTSASSAAPINNSTYTASLTFGNGAQIGTTAWYCVYKGTGTTVAITGLTVLQTYRVMVCEYNGTAGLEKYSTATATNNPNNQTTSDYAAPATQASRITFASVTISSMTANWTRGNGSNCIVFIKLASSGTPAPVNNTTYTANSTYSSGSQIGTSGWYCIYKGTGTSVAITGLSPVQTYRLMVCEYNGTAGLEKYLTNTATNNPNNQTTPDYNAPTTQALNVTFSAITGSSFNVSWTRGNGSNCVVFVRQTTTGSPSPVNNNSYSANSVFGSGSQIGSTGWYCVYNGNGTSVAVTGLAQTTTYRVKVCEFNGVSGMEKYNTANVATNPVNQATIYNPPTTQATNLLFTNITTTGMTASWTRGNGLNCIVFAKQTNSGSAVPVSNTTYTANAAFGSGSQIGTSGWYCVFKGNGATVNISGLVASTTYRIMVCEYNNGAGSEQYNTSEAANNPLNQTTDFLVPTIQAHSIISGLISAHSIALSWTRGNGNDCIVFLAKTNTGNATPLINTTYNADSTYMLGSTIGSSGWYCVYKGTGSSVTVAGLTGGTTYRAMVCEFNGTSGREKYYTSTAVNNPANFSTLAITTWTGTTWTDGTPDLNTDAIISGNLSLYSGIVCKTLTINFGDTVLVYSGGSITAYGNFTNHGAFALKSPVDTNATGSLITYGNIINDGIMVADRYISMGNLQPDNYVWHTMCSPMANYPVQLSYKGDYVCDFVESTNSWRYLKTGDVVISPKGYMVKTINANGKIIRFRGNFNTGDQSIDLTNNGAGSTYGYNLVGNPYPSAIDWNAAGGWTKTNIYDAIWIWNPSAGTYSSWDGTVGTNGGSRYIPAMQGFFVKVLPGYSTGVLSMTNETRVISNKSFMKRGIQNEIIRIRVNGNHYNDETVIYKADGLNSSYKLFGFDASVPQIYTLNNDTNYSIFKINPEVKDTIIQLGFRCTEDGEYSLNFDELSFENGTIILMDKLDNSVIKLKPGASYKFSHHSTDVENRFTLAIQSNSPTTSIVDRSGNRNIKIWAYSNKIYVDNQLEGRTLAEVYNLLGSKVIMKEMNSKSLEIMTIEKSGIYIVNVVNKGAKSSQKVVIK